MISKKQLTFGLHWGLLAQVLALSLITLAQAKTPRKFLVVLDPGHGGADTGAVIKDGKKTTYTEKEITLLMARDIARELIIKGHNVVLTRNDDRLVPLSDRTALANKLKADAFISIHLNSTSEKLKSGGIETFILSHATDEGSKRLADLENAVLKESLAAKSGQGDVSLIMKDMILDANLTPSKHLACAVQKHLSHTAHDRGVKQALFYVLLGADMPSILIEAGFMNAAKDLERVTESRSRMKMAAQISKAIDDYRLKRKSTQCQVQRAHEYHRASNTKSKSTL